MHILSILTFLYGHFWSIYCILADQMKNELNLPDSKLLNSSYPSENTHKSQRNIKGAFAWSKRVLSCDSIQPHYFESSVRNFWKHCNLNFIILKSGAILMWKSFFLLLFDDAVLLCNPPHLPQPLIVTHQRASYLIHLVAILKGIVHLKM